MSSGLTWRASDHRGDDGVFRAACALGGPGLALSLWLAWASPPARKFLVHIFIPFRKLSWTTKGGYS